LQPLQVVFALRPHREVNSIDGKDKVCLSGELSSIQNRQKKLLL
jgi:hypothetical protein